jgi:hypothetical protein
LSPSYRRASRVQTQYGGGLPTVQISDLYMPADGSFLRASTYGRGVWDITVK